MKKLKAEEDHDRYIAPMIPHIDKSDRRKIFNSLRRTAGTMKKKHKKITEDDLFNGATL